MRIAGVGFRVQGLGFRVQGVPESFLHLPNSLEWNKNLNPEPSTLNLALKTLT